ncbi:MAG TPA: DUF3823 domain-containing protein [Niabella sp.]|nr:DUF3823 domain-containing protein [Niabella sp.]HQW16369.1 DUF3823 domain-containing protein [Niabella sp.]HQX21621.1 DUF3823 domain-containing protein [Niabella sp.]HRB07190.1 DUF3823 domain-containing protein [Niabella sp.]HRB37220.1 DUF3823 domain-containing protein [Niabella sp.]
MKRKLYVISALLIVLFSACEKDNLKEPKSILSGKVTFQGQPIGVRSGNVQFEIWQSGYAFFTKIPLNIAQDGSFQATLHNGNYKLVRLSGAGPWANNTDTINVSLSGSATVDIPVEPFFVIKDASFTKNGTNVSATFTIEKNGTHSRTLEVTKLFIGRYHILDLGNNARSKDGAGVVLGQPVTVTLDIPAAIANDDFIFARIGVKTRDIGEYLYSASTKIQLK